MGGLSVQGILHRRYMTGIIGSRADILLLFVFGMSIIGWALYGQ